MSFFRKAQELAENVSDGLHLGIAKPPEKQIGSGFVELGKGCLKFLGSLFVGGWALGVAAKNAVQDAVQGRQKTFFVEHDRPNPAYDTLKKWWGGEIKSHFTEGWNMVSRGSARLNHQLAETPTPNRQEVVHAVKAEAHDFTQSAKNWFAHLTKDTPKSRY